MVFFCNPSMVQQHFQKSKNKKGYMLHTQFFVYCSKYNFKKFSEAYKKKNFHKCNTSNQFKNESKLLIGLLANQSVFSKVLSNSHHYFILSNSVHTSHTYAQHTSTLSYIARKKCTHVCTSRFCNGLAGPLLHNLNTLLKCHLIHKHRTHTNI